MAGRRQCSECYGYGHNKRTCPSRPEWRKEQDSKSHARRRCSYCHGVGHNRRKCATITQDLEVYRILTGALRKSRVERVSELDLGIGTMFTKNTWVRPSGKGSFEKKDVAWVITGINWNSLHLNERNPLRFYAIKPIGNWGMPTQTISFGLFDRKKLKDGTAHPAGGKQALATLPVGYTTPRTSQKRCLLLRTPTKASLDADNGLVPTTTQHPKSCGLTGSWDAPCIRQTRGSWRNMSATQIFLDAGHDIS